MRKCGVFVSSFVAFGLAAAAQAAVVADFEGGTTSGFGTATNSGITANTFTSPTSGTVSQPTSGGDTTKVLDLTASGFNGGLSSGASLGYDFAANGNTAAFLANNTLTFQWEVPPSAATGGYSQLYNIILNAPGPGYTNIGGSSGSTSPLATTTGTVNVGLYAGYTNPVNTVTIDYTAYKAAILANTTTPGYIQFEIQTNNGGGAPADIYFDNFSLSTTPEPASLGLLGLAGVGLVRRRRA
jgi:hypothetical protein